MGEWCALTDGIVATTRISSQEKAERGHRAAEKALRKEKGNKRHYIAIGFIGWGLGLSKSTDPAKQLARLTKINLGCREHKYLKTYLPIDAYFLDPQTKGKKSYLKIVVDNLPKPIKQLSLDQQIRFVCMALALIHQESKFNPNLQSQKGAKGAMQLMASTLRGMRQLYSSMIGPIGSVWNPNNNIRIGLTLLFHLLSDPAKDPDQRQYNEARMDYAFIAYNFGESGAKGVKTTAYQREVAVKYQLYHKLYSQQIKAALEPVRIVDVFQPPVYAPVILSR